MALYRRKHEPVRAWTFDELVEHGRQQVAPVGEPLRVGPNGMPWSFTLCGQPVTHERDDLYLVGALKVGPNDVLIELFPSREPPAALAMVSRELFDQMFELVPEAAS